MGQVKVNPTASPLAHLWPLRRDVAYLNHGSFGACPSAVLEYQRQLIDELERQPMDFLWRELPRRLAGAREALGQFIGASPDDLAVVVNATAGVNAVLRSLDFQPGDELLTTDHAYGACRKTLEYVASRCGARVTVALVPFPVRGADEVVGAILGAVTSRTRIAMIDHVTSPTALVLPIQRIVNELQQRGVDVLVDGAHALGMVPLELDRLGAAYYTANAHKWLCAPKGSAFLHVRRDRQHLIHPTSISHGYDPARGDARFREEFDWTGSTDPTAGLCIPESIRYMQALVPGGWHEVMARNRSLVLEARKTVCGAIGVQPPCPESMIGAIASILLPKPAEGSPAARLDHEQIMHWFRDRGIETWLYPWNCAGGKLIRLSAQLYNDESQFQRLADALLDALGIHPRR